MPEDLQKRLRELLYRELQSSGWEPKQLSLIMGFPLVPDRKTPSRLELLIQGYQPITVEDAKRILTNNKMLSEETVQALEELLAQA